MLFINNPIKTFIKFGQVFTGFTLIVAPFGMWMHTVHGSTSLVQATYTLWQESFSHLSFKAILPDMVVTICLLNLWLTALLLLKRFRGECAQGVCLTWLTLGVLFTGSVFWHGAEHVAWGYWMCSGALVAGLILELITIAAPAAVTAPDDDMTRVYTSSHVGA